MNSTVGALLLAVIVGLMTQGCSSGGVNDALIRKSASEIKAYILTLTPLGTPSKKVLSVIKSKLGVTSAQYSTNYHTFDPALAGYHGDIYVIGRIEGALGEIPGLFTMTDVGARWDFDAKGRLIDVTVTKQGTGP